MVNTCSKTKVGHIFSYLKVFVEKVHELRANSSIHMQSGELSLFSLCSVCSVFDMTVFVQLAKENHANGFSYRRSSQKLNLLRLTVHYMINNDHSRVKAKRGPKHVVVGFKKNCV